MSPDLIKTFGQIAGIGGLALGVLLVVFRDIISKNIFPKLEAGHAYLLLRMMIISVWSVAILGMASWAYMNVREKRLTPSPARQLTVPKLQQTVYDEDTRDQLTGFLDQHLGKLVYINIEVPSDSSSFERSDPDVELFTITRELTLAIQGKNYDLKYYKNQNILSGFFVINPNMELHQGSVYILESVPRAQVQMELQK